MVLPGVLCGTVRLVGAGRVPCEEVLREVTRLEGKRGTVAIYPKKIARKLKVEQEWVERCMQVYGRKFQNIVRVGEEDRPRAPLTDLWESEEPESWVPEDKEEDRPTRRERAAARRRPKLGLSLDEQIKKDLDKELR